MRQQDVKLSEVGRAVEAMGQRFHTRDISEHAHVVAAHSAHARDGNYHSTIGRALSENRSRFALREVAKQQQRGSLWEKRSAPGGPDPGVGEPVQAADALPSGPTGSGGPIRAGHRRALEAMRSPHHRRIVRLFADHPETGGAYLRVVEKGFQPVDLSPDSPKPLIGIGPAFAPSAAAEQLEAELPQRLAELRAKRANLAESTEKQLEARFIRHALASGLRLDPLPAALRFVAGQWRIDHGAGRGTPLDLLAVDIEARQLVVIELKAQPDPAAGAQAADYAAAIEAGGAEVLAFFGDLAAAMAHIHGCSDMAASLQPGVQALTVWPDGVGGFEVRRCR